MNHKQLLAIFLFLVIIASSRIVSTNRKVVEVRDVSSNIEKYKIENIKEEDNQKKINVFYPVTPYDNVNDIIKRKIEMYIDKFNNSSYISDTKKLEISFEEYNYNEYTSFKFSVKSNIGINHDFNDVFTVVYNKDNLIDINVLKSKRTDILDFLYTECYDKLINSESIKQYSNDEWVKRGLEKSDESYKNFVLTPKSLVVIFNEYTVAPYVAGILEVEIPYEKIGDIFS